MSTFFEAVEFYMLHARARQLSPNTLLDYNQTFAKFAFFIGIDDPPKLVAKSLGPWLVANTTARSLSSHTTIIQLWHYSAVHELIEDPQIDTIDHKMVESFLASFGDTLRVKSILNHHIGLRALWKWAVEEELVTTNIMSKVPAPKAETTIIQPYSKDEITRMLAACQYNKSYGRPGQRVTANRRQTSLRDRAVILVLVDTGLRSSEFRNLMIGDCNMKLLRLRVRDGKGRKERFVYFSDRTAVTLQRYLNTRKDKNDERKPLFVTRDNTVISSTGLLKFIQNLGNRSDVEGATVHRFRHTFAIQSLRNGLNPFVLQNLLGHSSIDMTKRYLALADQDIQDGHYHASPVAVWLL